MVSLRHRIFAEAAARSSFSEAGRALFISQPAVSRHIRELEEEYGLSLFERRGGEVQLTSAGEALYTRVREAMALERKLQVDLSEYQSPINARAHLRLGASTTVALYVLPRILSAFLREHPKLSIDLLNRNSDSVTRALLQDEIDLGIAEGKTKLTSLSYQAFLSDRVVAVCSAQSPIARKKKLTLEALKEVPVVLREPGSGTLEALTDALKKEGISMRDLNVKVRLGGTEALKNFIREDTALGFLPYRSVARELAGGELKEVQVGDLKMTRTFYLIRPQGRDHAGGVVRSFARFIGSQKDKA